jgi:uncharacterized protein (TIGR02147 family)
VIRPTIEILFLRDVLKNSEIPDIFNYSDPTLWLKESLRALSINPLKPQFRYFSIKLGYSNPRILEMVLKGTRLPSRDMALRVSRFLNLDAKRYEFLELLIARKRLNLKNKNTSVLDAKINQYKIKIKVSRKIKTADLTVFKYWYTPVILTLWQIPKIRTSLSPFELIFQKLGSQIARPEFNQVIESLQSLGYFSLDTSELLFSPSDIPSKSIQEFHIQNLDRSKEMLTKRQILEREFLGMTLTMNPKDLPTAKVALRKFLQEFNDRFQSDESDHPYSLNMQFYSQT